MSAFRIFLLKIVILVILCSGARSEEEEETAACDEDPDPPELSASAVPEQALIQIDEDKYIIQLLTEDDVVNVTLKAKGQVECPDESEQCVCEYDPGEKKDPDEQGPPQFSYDSPLPTGATISDDTDSITWEVKNSKPGEDDATVPGEHKFKILSVTQDYTCPEGWRETIEEVSKTNDQSSKEITIIVPKVDIAMDGNRDGTIDFDDPKDAEYLFWVNDDIDARALLTGYEDDRSTGTPNCDDNVINSKRDLEDFTRLHIKVNKDLQSLSGVTYWMKFENINHGFPEVNIFRAVDDSLNYLNDGADLQMGGQNRMKLITVGSTEVQLPNTHIRGGDEISPFLLEGKAAGKGDLTIIVKRNDEEIYKRKVSLELRPITQFRQIHTVWVTDGVVSGVSVQVSPGNYTYTPEEDDYVLFVHGWNMEAWEIDRWTETVFKRLWWQGYKGHVGGFRWPTVGSPGVNYRSSFRQGERRAWESAPALADLLMDLDSSHSGKVRVIAHSLGNVVVGEAIRSMSSTLVHTYIATQAAISAHCYDNGSPEILTDIKTPNIYGFYTTGQTPSQEYLVYNHAKVSNEIVRYFNPDDPTLGGGLSWESVNSGKPGHGYVYIDQDSNIDTYNPGAGDYFRRGWTTELFLPLDRYEIFAYMAQARSRALGREANNIRNFGVQWNLAGAGYDDSYYGHSRQFRSNIADEWDYWDNVMDNFDL